MESPDGINPPGVSEERNRSGAEDYHLMTLTEDYHIGKYEVFQAQWEAVMGTPADRTCDNNTTYGVGDNCPVYFVSWDEIAGTDGFNRQA